MEQKMRRFTDAGLYAQDADIDFLPESHTYLYRGERQLLPVSNLIAYFFEQFNAQRAAERQLTRYGIPIELSLAKWERTGRMASEVGTFLHEQTENYFHNGTFLTNYDFSYNGGHELISIEPERQHFMRFIHDYTIIPYRQEWPVYDKELNIAGTIDMVCRESDNVFVIYDWKRSRKILDNNGIPIIRGFNGRTSINGIQVPDTAYCHYCIQQNLYRYMLERNYGVKVKALYLVVLCAEYDNYRLVPVPLLDDIVNQIATLCKQQDLGWKLLR